ncbi:MAG: hypothetical protein HQL69_23260 [Magnetococcales bacterium]|nr:hypothetical protein [Magnetococcales bacterium]
MAQYIGLAAVVDIVEVNQWVMRLFSTTADESRGYAKHVLTTAFFRFIGEYCI